MFSAAGVSAPLPGRQVIERHIMSNDDDPFNRQSLSVKDGWCFWMGLLLRGSGYLGYVDSNRGYNLYKWVICPQILGL